MRVVLAEDSLLLREELVRLLGEAGAEVIEAVGDGEALVRAVVAHRPDVAMVDVRMPQGHTEEGLRAALEARRKVPGTAVLVLSQYVEESYAGDLLAGALERVVAGGTVLDPEVVAQLLTRRRRDPLDALTPREREVLALMAEGRTNAAIARKLLVTQGAIEKHISSILTKLDLHPSEDEHRRVMAVLAWLRGRPA